MSLTLWSEPMAPRMSKDERIDLTRFEGMTEGPWEAEEWLDGQIVGPISERHNNNHPIIAVVGDGWWGDMLPECDANYRAMAAVPELIAKLKRCYEEIDELKELCDEFMGQALTLYDVGNQHKDVDYDYQEFNKLRTRFAELLDFKSASE